MLILNDKSKMNRISNILITLGIIVLSACQPDSSTETTVEENSKKTYAVPKFGRDSAYNFVARQIAFGPRVPNSEGHKACKEWLTATLRGFGAKVIEQDFQATAYTGTVLNGTNIIAQYNPESNKRILLAAHWDTRHIADSPLNTERRDEPVLGADDGGSGVGVLLEVARVLQANPIEAGDLGVDIILFDAEDHGEDQGNNPTSWALGSQHWSRNPHVSGNKKPKYGILLDMVGSKGARFPKEEISRSFAPQLTNKIWKLANDMGYGNFFAQANAGSVTDDHYFVNTIAKIPMVDIINLPNTSGSHSFGNYWHTHNDNMDVINRRTLRAVGQVVLAIIYREASGNF